MSHRFVRCPHCKMPHDAAERVCPTTGRRIEVSITGGHARPRMSELPPPERKPEPLGFDPAKNRMPDREAAAREAAARAAAVQHDAHAEFIGRTVSDRYIIKGVLGEGGMGTVYEAEHLGLGRSVAIKVLNPSQAKKRVAVKRFQQEARAAGAIGHPNICEVYDLGLLDDGSPYLVMEKLSGTTLADRIAREGGLPFDEITDVMIQVLSGLIAAHDKGIVHRDIKPENIFLAQRVGCPPIVKILDFGVSKMMPQFQGGDEQLDLTRTGMVMGTPYYMSPEQARGERSLDGRVDVYACGVMMYESIVGKRPFLAPNYNALLLSIINTTPTPLREVRPSTPPAMEAIVVRSMAKARDDRYRTANAVLRDLQALNVAPPAIGARVPAPPTPAERMRAPVLGGRAAHEQVREEGATRGPRGGQRARVPEGTDGAGPTLRSRTADAPPLARDRDNATRHDIKASDLRGSRDSWHEDSGSIDIPFDVGESEPAAARAAPPRHGVPGDYVDEMPTEIFRPGMHAAAARPAPSPAPPSMGPVNVSGLVGDEWDGETVVKKPAALTTSRHRDRPSRESSRRVKAPPQAQPQPQPQPKPFHADETVVMHGGDLDIDVDFGDDAHDAAPPRRPR